LYQVQITDLNGCTATDQIQLILNKERRVYLPNVFSPNGDGANDIFFVQTGPEVVKIEAFEVYSRWGEPVFTVFNAPTNNPDYGWDGQYRGELLNGAVFTWFAKVEYVDGVVELFQGDVVLMR
jgi:gliding motility-associated-like protein